MREEVKWFLAKSAPQLPGWSFAWRSYGGGTNAVTKRSFPFFPWAASSCCGLAGHVAKFLLDLGWDPAETSR